MSFTEARGDKKRRRAETMKRDVLRAEGLLDEEGLGLPCLPGGERDCARQVSYPERLRDIVRHIFRELLRVILRYSD